MFLITRIIIGFKPRFRTFQYFFLCPYGCHSKIEGIMHISIIWPCLCQIPIGPLCMPGTQQSTRLSSGWTRFDRSTFDVTLILHRTEDLTVVGPLRDSCRDVWWTARKFCQTMGISRQGRLSITLPHMAAWTQVVRRKTKHNQLQWKHCRPGKFYWHKVSV